MRKLGVSFILVIFMFSVFYPAIYAMENIPTNTNETIPEKEEMIEIENEEEIKTEEKTTQEETENIVFPENRVEKEEITENQIENVISNITQELETTPEEDISEIEETVSNEEMKTVIENPTGAICIDSPIENTMYTNPDNVLLTLSGWAVSDDEKSVVKLYVNGTYWQEIKREVMRNDVNAVYPQYANTTEKAGYRFVIDVSTFPEGRHEIKLEQVSRYGKVINTETVRINVKQKQYTGAICIDSPIENTMYTNPDNVLLTLSGWAVSDDEKSVVKLYVNGTYWQEIKREVMRNDVNVVYPQYANTTAKAGYRFVFDVSTFPEGRHEIKLEQVSRYGKVINTETVRINVKQKQYTGAICIDNPIENTMYTNPDNVLLTLSGWAVSDDEKSVVKLYVNGTYWQEIKRELIRNDVNVVYPQYANTTAKAGYRFVFDVSTFPEGRHEIKLEQVSRYGKVINTETVRINVKQKQYTGAICIDNPIENTMYTNPDNVLLTLSGWAVSDDEKSVVKLYVNGTYWQEIKREVMRNDVNAVYPQYANTTEKAGYRFVFDVSTFPEGRHEIKLEQVSRIGKVINTATTNVYVSTPDYPGLMCIDAPIHNKRYTSGVLTISGWAVTTSPVDYIDIYLDGVYQTGGEKRPRADVVNIYGSEFGLTSDSKPGFYSEIATGYLGEGIHTVKVVQYSKYHKKIQELERSFMISNTTTWGIDVSHHNGAINWDAVRNSGVNFAILKIGEYRESTGRTLKDEHFEEYYAACKARGIAVGGYIYSYAFNPNEALHEAEACLSMIQGKSFEMPIFFDLEDHLVSDAINSGRTDVQNVTNAVITFCDTMQSRGYQAGVYSYRNFFYEYLDMSALEKYHVWLAHYVSETDYTGKYDMWQYTSSGSLPGISGNVDLNWCFKRFY